MKKQPPPPPKYTSCLVSCRRIHPLLFLPNIVNVYWYLEYQLYSQRYYLAHKKASRQHKRNQWWQSRANCTKFCLLPASWSSSTAKGIILKLPLNRLHNRIIAHTYLKYACDVSSSKQLILIYPGCWVVFSEPRLIAYFWNTWSMRLEPSRSQYDTIYIPTFYFKTSKWWILSVLCNVVVVVGQENQATFFMFNWLLTHGSKNACHPNSHCHIQKKKFVEFVISTSKWWNIWQATSVCHDPWTSDHDLSLSLRLVVVL